MERVGMKVLQVGWGGGASELRMQLFGLQLEASCLWLSFSAYNLIFFYLQLELF